MTEEISTIVAVSTPPGTGGIAVIRMSGPDSLDILSKVWKGGEVERFQTHTAHLGWITDGEGGEIDQVVVTVFKGPNSYTGENVVELSCHGSPWIQQTIVSRLTESGASPALAGEFTRRAFINGRLDLAQAEGVADMIEASSKAAARLAATRLKGDYSRKLEALRKRIVDLCVLLELELDFSEEEVEFADRSQLITLARELHAYTGRLADSFKAGNVFKNGIPVVIAGVPNAGKSTLLNALIGEDKAIVSDIPGTTRDAIEDTLEISGILFRFIDTAGLRESDDKIERIGVERALKKISDSSILLFLIDPTQDIEEQKAMLGSLDEIDRATVILTKADICETVEREIDSLQKFADKGKILKISAKDGYGITELKHRLTALATSEFNPEQELIVTNARHHKALMLALKPLERLIEGLENGISADFLAQDIREAESYIGEITGAVASTEILHTIFSRYCIGK